MRLLARLGLFLVFVPALTGALPPDERAADLARIEDYLNDLTTLEARFVQFAPDGSRSTGDLFFKRPDKMRLDYDPPSPILIIANGWELTYHDRRLEQTSQMFTSSTPLGFLLDDQIELSGDVTVVDYGKLDDQVRVSVVQSDEPDQGRLTLIFDQEPLQLRRWAVTDAQGLTTHVVLDDIELGQPIDNELFRFREKQRYD